MYIGRLETKAAASPLRQPVTLSLFRRLLSTGKSQVNYIFSCVPLSVAVLLFPTHREKGDRDDSPALDEITILNAAPCFPVFGLISLSSLVP